MDPRSFFRTSKLTFVDKTKEKDDIWSFRFRSEKPIHHIAGQHGLFTIPGLAAFRIFSLASAPEEDMVMIGTHVHPESAFKQRLATLDPGDTINMLGPVMVFTLKPDVKDVVFLAQGIGITPFRSMLIHARKKKLAANITLIHVDKSDHVYRSETAKLAHKASYPTDPAGFNADVDQAVKNHPDATYYLSGSPRFNNATIKTLRSLGIKRLHIKTDSFLGY